MSRESMTFRTARSLSGARASEEELLETLCDAAEARLGNQLRPGVSPEQCGVLFPCAAAALAAADLCLARSGSQEVHSFRAGAVSIQGTDGNKNCELAKELRRSARVMLAGFIGDSDFAVRGVPG